MILLSDDDTDKLPPSRCVNEERLREYWKIKITNKSTYICKILKNLYDINIDTKYIDKTVKACT